MLRRACLGLFCLIAIRCGSSSPASPSSSATASLPSSFRSASQQVNFTNNTITFTWTGTSGSYKLSIGTASGLSDVLSTTVSDTTYTWTAPRTANTYYARVANTSGDTSPAQEIPVFTLDLRDAIDAMYFGGGTLSESPTVNPGNAPAAVFADGAAVTVVVTNEAASTQMALVQQFAADYQAASGNAFPIAITTSANDYKGASLASLPVNTVVVRVYGACTQVGVIACANYGPSPVGTNRSYVNMNAATADSAKAVAHELGHSFGIHHIRATSATRSEYAFLMNPALITPDGKLTQVEKNAIAAARAGGLRNGWTRNQALAAGLVLPFTGAVAGPPAAWLDDIIKSPVDVIR